jgi:biopolymer transport protein TolR
MAMSFGKSGKTRAEINLTPMIDVLLVLIIIFMVITPRTTGLDALLPSPAPDSAHSAVPDGVVITVLGDGTVRLNDEPLDRTLLHERLLRIFGTRANSVVFIRGEKDLDFGQVAEVIDITKGAGVDRVGLMIR